MKTMLKFSLAAVAITMLFASCDQGDNTSVSDVNVKDTYTFSITSSSQTYIHFLVFNDDYTWDFISGSGIESQNKSGTFSVSGNTLTMNTDSPTSISEKFTVSKNNNSLTITLKGNSPVSNIFSLFPIAETSITMTKGYILTYNVGDTGPGGGIIYYRRTDGFTMSDTGETCHYLEAAPQDIPTELAWASPDYTNTQIEPNQDIINTYPIGKGRKNTAVILATDSQAPAAKACADYRGGGKNDWFLPSVYELTFMLDTDISTFDKNNPNLTYLPIDNLSFSHYWSSSESGGSFITYVAKSVSKTSDNITSWKTTTLGVRPIRAF